MDLVTSVRKSAPQAASDKPTATLFPGTGRFIDTQAARKPAPITQVSGEVTLNFERADIREVVKVVFDTLGENYVIDPQVQGEVTVQTGRPLPRDLLIPTLETLLRMNNAALVAMDGIYKVVPMANAVAGSPSPRLGGVRARPGYRLHIVPLRYISASEMQKILEPLVPQGSIVLVDPARNLLMLAGTAQELANAEETIDIFDVNWLKGMSVGIYRLRNVDSQTVAAELENLFGAGSQLPLAGMFRFLPVSQLNAVLVITPQPEYLREAGLWVERLDGVGGERLYVYEIQNGKADYLATLLNEVFGVGAPGAPRPAQVAPGLTPTTLTAPAETQETTEESPGGTGAALTRTSSAALARPSPGASELSLGAEQVRIIADVENNSLLIWASSQNYDKILDALHKLDVAPRQVLVEAMIAEVTLSGSLQYGLQWFFKNNELISDNTGSGLLEFNTQGRSIANIVGTGFSYAITNNAGEIRALLEILASESKVKVLSSPQILVIDNQEASIRVGTQQPFQTATTTTEGGVITQSTQLKDTGVLLEVSPQVNAGGLVTLDINQEVTDVGDIDAATGQRTFEQRSIKSRVAVQSGQSIVLGGLIRDRRDNSESGIPVLYELPVIGPLFGTNSDSTRRTELLVLLTPRVIENSRDAEQVTNELKLKMKSVVPLITTYSVGE